jgi:LPS-assembly lipoprotein
MTDRIRRRFLIAAGAGALLGGCGFRLRGDVSLPFQSIYISAAENSAFAAELSRALAGGSNVTIASRPEDAEAILEILGDTREKQILTLTSAGTVAEFLLRYRVTYRLRSKDGRELVPRSEILLTRDYAFNNSLVLAKDTEETLFYRDMQSDAVQQVLRRLRKIKI